jgi:hypothetical protein
MPDELTYLDLPPDTNEWQKLFAAAGVDCVMDPMVARAADLFIGGPDYCRQMTQTAPDDLWPAMQNNVDAILAFFHILMTRDRIPLIDYGDTFSSRLDEWLGSSIILRTSAASAYPEVKTKALQRLSIVAANFPRGKSLDLDKELLAVGYFWQPNLDGLPVVPEATAAAQFVLGGMVFGAYADAAFADHVLQSKRLQMMTDLENGMPAVPDDWQTQERALFAKIAEIANQDRSLTAKDEIAVPNVLLHLLADRRKSPRALLDQALEMRDSSAGRSYRAFHKRLRDAWHDGRRDDEAERQIDAVATELKQRISGEPTIIAHLMVGANLTAGVRAKFDAGIAAVDINAKVDIDKPKTPVSIIVPRALRNWFVDDILFSRHQKLLLRMAQSQHKFENIRRGLYAAWRRT